MGLFDKIGAGFKKIGQFIGIASPIEDSYYEELEEMLIMGDVGAATSFKIVEELRDRVKKNKVKDSADVLPLLKEIIVELLSPPESVPSTETPKVILVIGVNGVGKTTTIGKLASKLKKQGNSVLLAAADTFRAAAIEQLSIWGERSGCDVIKQSQGSDPAAVIYDAVSSGKAKKVDYIICDTAGRLHNKKNLMDELAKINRVILKELPNSKPEVLLVVDATTGQNALSQVKLFGEVAPLDGIVLTKLDGTAKGGVVIGIMDEAKVPVKYVGLGEGIDDLQPFSAVEFTDALFGE